MNRFFGRNTNTQRAFSRLMMTSALVAAGTLSIASSAKADPWADVTGSGFTNTSGGANITNIVATTSNGKASGTGKLDILAGQTVNINAALFVARDNRPTIQTSILGSLNSNGKVVLIDRNGVLFGKGSSVNVGSIIASTGDLNDAQALADGTTPLLFTDFGTADITNNGTIQATGLVAFVAPTVRNAGVINANLGRVSLDAGSTTATVDLYGDGLVAFATSPVIASGKTYTSENTGSITAGKIQMTAAAASSVVNSVVNMEGVLTANSAIINKKGEIVLSAGTVAVGKPTTKTVNSVKGNTKITATQLDLGLTIDGDVSGSAKSVNILSSSAKIAQGLDMVSTGGKITVAGGTYNEHLVVDTAGVTLTSKTGEIVLINPNSPGVEITADDVTVNGLTFANALGSNGYGIFVNGGDNATLTNNTILNVAQSGIYVLNSIGGTISGNNIGASGAANNIGKDGIHLLNTSGITVSGNTIANTTSPSIEVGSGIYAEKSDDTIISGNTIYSVTWDGIKVRGGSDTQVIGNDIYSLSRSGIGIDKTDNVVISDNIIDNVILGVWSYNNSNIQILDNSVSNITTSVNSNGIQTNKDNGVVISGNIIDNTYLDGVYSKDSSNVTITDNVISNTGRTGAPTERGNGIRLDGGTNNVISNNNITATKWDGIKVVTSNGVQVTGNDIYDLNRSGVSIDRSAGAVVSDNAINNILLGVWSYHNSDIQITDNNITNIKASVNGNGIQSYEDNGVVISGNTISNAYLNGIYSLGSTNLEIIDNNIEGSGTNGIALNNVKGVVTVDSNTITESHSNGILAYYSTVNPIELHIVNNAIQNTGSGIAALNLDVSSDGYVEVSGNTLEGNFDYGLLAYSGLIDLTGATNTIQNTRIGMGFYPNKTGSQPDTSAYFDYLATQLSLVNNTIGTTAFIDQSQLFVDLGYGAMYAPGTPTQLDGNNATYTLTGLTIDPFTNGGITSDEYDTLEGLINHYVDTQNNGQFFFNILPAVSAARATIDQKDVLRNNFGNFAPAVAGGNLTITGLPLISAAVATSATPAGFNPAAIEPAAGDETANASAGLNVDDVANIQPAAGGDTSCWSDATASLGQGAPVTFNYGSTGTAMLQNAASCGTGQGQSL